MLKMGKASRDKGYRGEHEVEGIFREYGIDAQRGLVFRGEPDIMVDGLHVEVKRCERIELPKWWKQSTEAAKKGEIPVVVFRKNRGEWMITLRLTDFLQLRRTWKYEEDDDRK